MAPTRRPHEAPMLSDTSPEALAVQMQVFRGMGPQERSRLANELSEAVIESTRNAVARSRPGASPRELLVAFVAACYGDDLARSFAAHLNAR
jgi:hypothetical protein